MTSDQALAYKIEIDSYRHLFKIFCRLSDSQVEELQEACFKKAITTIRPNSEVVLELMKHSYRSLIGGKSDYNKIIEGLKP